MQRNCSYLNSDVFSCQGNQVGVDDVCFLINEFSWFKRIVVSVMLVT